MISQLLSGAHRLDEWLRTRIGRPYHALLGVGLVVEIAKELHERWEHGSAESGFVKTALALALFAALLVHELGELREHFERRGERRR
jgi:hypothetical protein